LARSGRIFVAIEAMKIYIDGKYYDQKNAKISVFDHGLLYGDGIFEGIRAYMAASSNWPSTSSALFYSAKAILLKIPLTPEQVARAVVETCRKNKLRDGYIRLVVTRGVGTWG
jgi:branched-chain amino acid aminotransferase